MSFSRLGTKLRASVLAPLLGLERDQDINGFACIVTLVILGVLNVAILFISPVKIGAMVELLGFSESHAAYIISIELAGICLATLPALYWSSRVNWRIALLVALMLMIFGNILSAISSSYEMLLTLRFLTGLAAGSSMAICLAILGLTRDPDRNFGFWVAGQLIFGALGLWVLPQILPELGFGFIYLVIGTLIVGLLFLLRFLPEQRDVAVVAKRSGEGGQSTGILLWACAGLLAIFVFYLGQYGIWAYLERIGADSGLSPQGIGRTLSVAAIMGIGGALAAALLSARCGRIWPISLGTVISILSMFLLSGKLVGSQYLIATSIFSAMFNFILPYLMACIASVDISGRFIILSSFASGAGLAGGPLIAAAVQQPSGYDEVIWVGLCFTLIALLLIAGLAMRSSTSTRATPHKLDR